MCRAIEEGGRRCVGTRREYDAKVKKLTDYIEKKKEVLASIQRRIDDKDLPSDKIADAKIRFVTENDIMRKWEAHLEEMRSHWDQSEEGMEGLRAEIANSLENSPQYIQAHARLMDAEKARAEAKARREEYATKLHNLVTVMKGEGYSDEEIEEMRQLTITAYSYKTTPSEKTLKKRLDNAQKTWDSMKKPSGVAPGGDVYEEHSARLRRIADTRSLSSEERIERINVAKAEFEVKKNVAELNFKNARDLYDTTATGRKELEKKIARAEKNDLLVAISALSGRRVQAEAAHRLIRRSDNARGQLKRDLTSMAKARGLDTTKVWNAVRNVNPLDRNGNPIQAPDPSDRRKHITLNLNAKDVANIRSDYEKTEGFNKKASKQEQEAGFREYVSARLASTDFKAYHNASSVVEANRRVRTGSTGRAGRNTTDVEGNARKIRFRVSVTHKQEQNLKAISGHLETTKASVARRLALGGRENLFSIQNDRSNDAHWKKMTRAAQEHLGEEVTENYR